MFWNEGSKCNNKTARGTSKFTKVHFCLHKMYSEVQYCTLLDAQCSLVAEVQPLVLTHINLAQLHWKYTVL